MFHFCRLHSQKTGSFQLQQWDWQQISVLKSGIMELLRNHRAQLWMDQKTGFLPWTLCSAQHISDGFILFGVFYYCSSLESAPYSLVPKPSSRKVSGSSALCLVAGRGEESTETGSLWGLWECYKFVRAGESVQTASYGRTASVQTWFCSLQHFCSKQEESETHQV